MRDLIVRLLGRLALALIPGANPRGTLLRWTEALFPATGKHRVPAPAPAPVVICSARLPVPVHVLRRSMPIVEVPRHRIPPYYLAHLEQRQCRKRRRELFWATMGLDYPGVQLRRQ
ncbi:hypothetical protein GCM10027168_01980 [Streptomyces capparidis]